MLRKVTRDGHGYSVVDLNDVRHVLAVAVPRGDGDLKTQAQEALRTIEAVHDEEDTLGSIVHQAVFVADPELIPSCRAIIREFYGEDLPATSFVIQPPCQGKLLAIEAIGVGRGKADVRIERFSDQLVRVTHNVLSWVHCANITPRGRQRRVQPDRQCALATPRDAGEARRRVRPHHPHLVLPG